MEANLYPFLCGGTYFSLILNARKQRSNGRKHNECDVFNELIKITDDKSIKYNSNSFKEFISTYKRCSEKLPRNSTYLPFTDSSQRKIFDERIKSDYPTLLTDMCNFAHSFIGTDLDPGKCLWLAKALLELVKEDGTIGDEQEFYALQNGQPIKKFALVELKSICLPALLLGIWHFIIFNEIDNKKGKNTYNKWHGEAEQHAKREFASNIGKNFQYPQHVSLKIEDIPNTPVASSNVTDVSLETSVTPMNPLVSSNNNDEVIIPQNEIPSKESVKVVESTEKPRLTMEPSLPSLSSEAINNSQEPDKDDIVENKLLFFNFFFDDFSHISEVMTEDIYSTILNVFTSLVRKYEILNFLKRDDLEFFTDIDIFVVKVKEACTPYKEYIEKVLETDSNPREKKFFHSLLHFINSLNSFNNWIGFVRQSFRNITVLSNIREEELSEPEIEVLVHHKEAIKLFCEICTDNNLSYEDIVPRDPRENDQFSGYVT